MIYDNDRIIEYADMVKSVRTALGMTRKEFAEHMGVSSRTIDFWESYTSFNKTIKGPTYKTLVGMKENLDNGSLANANPGRVLPGKGRPRKHPRRRENKPNGTNRDPR